LTPTPVKPLSNEPSDLKSTETETMVPGQAEFKQGQDLAAAGKYAEAIEAYKKSLKLAKDDPATYQAMGVAYRMLNRYDEAIVALTEAIRIQPEVAEPYLRRGICWFQKQEYGLAGQDFDDAAGIDFTDPRAATWKGMTLARQGLMLDAINTYSGALRYDNRFVLGHINRGLAYAALHDYKKAIVDFNAAINVTPKDPTIYFKRAVAESSNGDWHAAVISYSEAIRLDKNYAAAFKNRSEAYRQLGDTAHAAADSKRAQELTLAAPNSAANSTARR
jgi:tetratricopeptide (TPR) repeat protein